MLIYEVNLAVEGAIAEEYAEFLRHHMTDVVKVGGFLRAEWWQREAADEGLANADDRVLWTVHYHVATRELLDRYLREQAPKLRSEAIERFGNRFTATRRILTLTS
jgi:hypothetical protein